MNIDRFHAKISAYPMAKVVFEGVSKEYPQARGEQRTVIESLNLTIEDRELMVLVGPSGSGKSTILRMIAGLETISRGKIFIDNKCVNEVPPKKRNIAMVFQNSALYPHKTAFENMVFGLEYQGVDKKKARALVAEAALAMGVEQVLHLKPAALTRAQRQCVALGRALVHKPKVFLFDEPLSSLDARMRVSMRTEISKLHARLSTTMIHVTHDQVEAMTMGDRIAVINEGKVLQVDEPISLYNHPATMFVGGFIGSLPMNFIYGRIDADSGRLFFVEKNEVSKPIRLRLPESLAQKAASYLGKSIVLGIRCEDISDLLVMANPDREQIIEAKVEVCEPLGSLTYLYLDTGGHSIVARSIGCGRFEMNMNLRVYFDMERAHLFDPETEAVLR